MLFSESDRFAPSLISLKTYNLLLILEPRTFFYLVVPGNVLKCCRNQWRPAFLHILCFVCLCCYGVFSLSLLALLPMTTTFMHHSYSNDDNKHHLLFFRGKYGRTRKKEKKKRKKTNATTFGDFFYRRHPTSYPIIPRPSLTLNNTDEKNRAVITDCWYEICTFWSLTQTTIHRVTITFSSLAFLAKKPFKTVVQNTDNSFFFFFSCIFFSERKQEKIFVKKFC